MSYGNDIFGYDDDDDDDDDDDAYSADSASEPASTSHVIAQTQSPIVERVNRPQQSARAKPRQLRARQMTPLMRQKHPGVVSITLTRDDGTQTVFVR